MRKSLGIISPSSHKKENIRRSGTAGYYYPEADGNVLAWSLRRQFLDTVRQIAPQVLVTLRDEVLPTYREAQPLVLNATPRRTLRVHGRRRGRRVNLFDSVLRSHWGPTIALSDRDFASHTASLRDALIRWVDHFGLSAEWTLKVALATLRSWSRHPEALEQLAWEHRRISWDAAVTGEEATFVFRHRYWDPASETWSDFWQEICAAFNEYGAFYRKKVEAIAESKGFRRAPQKRAQEHFEWLARYQMKRESLEDISSSVPITRQAVSRAINELAGLIELPLRPPLPGIKKRRTSRDPS